MPDELKQTLPCRQVIRDRSIMLGGEVVAHVVSVGSPMKYSETMRAREGELITRCATGASANADLSVCDQRWGAAWEGLRRFNNNGYPASQQSVRARIRPRRKKCLCSLKVLLSGFSSIPGR